jgi:hypothetical protein
MIRALTGGPDCGVVIRHRLADARYQFFPEQTAPGRESCGSTGWWALVQHYRNGGELDAADARRSNCRLLASVT